MVLPLPYFTGLGRLSLLNSTSPSCLGELMLNSTPRLLPDFARLLAGFALQALRHLGEHFGVDLDAGGFHARQHRRHRQIDVVVDLGQAGCADFVAQLGGEPQREVGGFAERVAHLQVEGAEGDIGESVLRVGRVRADRRRAGDRAARPRVRCRARRGRASRPWSREWPWGARDRREPASALARCRVVERQRECGAWLRRRSRVEAATAQRARRRRRERQLRCPASSFVFGVF